MNGETKKTIICSTLDRASQNIKKNLLALEKWDTVSEDVHSIFEFRDIRIFEITESLIYQDALDKKLMDLGFPCSLLIFASKHRSEDGRAVLTVHSTGNVSEAKYGGNKKELAQAAPHAVRSLLRSLKVLTENTDYKVTLECTHHGPSDIHVPSVFVEIGSDEEQWLDEAAGRIVASAILEIKEEDSPVAVGFGGTHYAPRQTGLILETDITFGHIFPNHVLSELDEELIRQAFTRSGADFAYFDRKSMKAHEREKLGAIVRGSGFEVLKESEIREKFSCMEKL